MSRAVRSEPAALLPLESLAEATLLIDRSGAICEANTQAATLFGCAREALKGCHSDELVAPSAREEHGRRRSQYLAGSPLPRPLCTVRAQRRDGTEFMAEFAVSPLPPGSSEHAIVSIRDISRHCRIEEALREEKAAVERTAAARDRFFATMSHDLRAPLNAIIGFSGTLLMRLPGPLTEAQEHQLGIIRHSGQQLLALLNDVIDLAKMESGRARPRRETFDVAVAVEEVATRLRHHAERKHLSLEVRGGEGLRFTSDRRALQQILQQLLDNAIKFSDRGAVTMELRTVEREGSGWIEISVTDSGCGLAPADRDRLRYAFINMDRPIPLGGGLGLHVARKFAELMGGRLELDSEPGKGSRFSLLLSTE